MNAGTGLKTIRQEPTRQERPEPAGRAGSRPFRTRDRAADTGTSGAGGAVTDPRADQCGSRDARQPRPVHSAGVVPRHGPQRHSPAGDLRRARPRTTGVDPASRGSPGHRSKHFPGRAVGRLRAGLPGQCADPDHRHRRTGRTRSTPSTAPTRALTPWHRRGLRTDGTSSSRWWLVGPFDLVNACPDNAVATSMITDTD